MEVNLPHSSPSYIYEGNNESLFEQADGPTLNRTPRQIQENVRTLAQLLGQSLGVAGYREIDSLNSPYLVSSNLLVVLNVDGDITINLQRNEALEDGDTIIFSVKTGLVKDNTVTINSGIGSTIENLFEFSPTSEFFNLTFKYSKSTTNWVLVSGSESGTDGISQEAADARYLNSANNLSDVADSDEAIANLGIISATMLAEGLIRVSTTEETLAGESNSSAVTPAGLSAVINNLPAGDVNLFFGEFGSLAELNTNTPQEDGNGNPYIGIPGQYAYVNTGMGDDVTLYLWDFGDTAWVNPVGTAGALNTGAAAGEIRTNNENEQLFVSKSDIGLQEDGIINLGTL